MRPKLAIAADAVALLAVLLILRTTFAQAPQTAPPTLTPEELQVYRKAHTVIDWTPKEIRGRRELKGLQPAGSQGNLAKILQEAGERVAAFIENLPNVTATESIQWQVDSPSSKDLSSQKFRYLLMRRPTAGGETFAEYRTDPQGNEIDYNGLQGSHPLTSGFTLSLLYFDPHNQAACRYRYFGRQMLGEQETDVVGFAQIPEGNLRLANLYDGKRRIPLLFQGLAWIDHRTHGIMRLETDLLSPPPHTSLQRETTRIDYAPVQLPGVAGAVMLPDKVVVDAWLSVNVLKPAAGFTGGTRQGITVENPPVGEKYRQHYRNIHSYSDYKLFRVESRIGPTP
ncbi:MAG: hypothetical protein ABSA59_05155 [Terriglobia bacterium]|jgi:hypothetical protein